MCECMIFLQLLTSTLPLIIEVPSPPVLRWIVWFVSFSAIASQVKSNVHALRARSTKLEGSREQTCMCRTNCNLRRQKIDLSEAQGGRQHWVFWFHLTTLSLPYVCRRTKYRKPPGLQVLFRAACYTCRKPIRGVRLWAATSRYRCVIRAGTAGSQNGGTQWTPSPYWSRAQ